MSVLVVAAAAGALAGQGAPTGPVELTAASLSFAAHGRRAVAEGAVVVRREDATLHCDRAVADYDAEGKDLTHLETAGHVTLARGATRARADTGTYDARDDAYVLVGHAEVDRGGDVLAGDRITLHGARDDLEVERAAGVLRHAAGGPLRFTTEMLDVHDREHRALFRRGVVLRRGDVVVRAPRMDARYAANGEIEHLHLSGGVEVEQGTRRATAREADYVAAEGRLWLSGAPELHDGGDVVRGARIGYGLGSGDVSVEKAVARVRPQGAGAKP